ncbi:N-acetyltransferase family protein [Microbacterium sp. 22242]|uniref:GNAT family N-acetyltransferase n=1 Tax=Microbacterium sp. 22242 TaxID=3453896 RepID=UPI003F87FE83
MVIRPATPEDAQGIAVVHVRSWQEAYRGLLPQAVLDELSVAAREEAWLRTLTAAGDGSAQEGPRSRTVVAAQDDRILGWATFGDARDEAGPGAELWGLYAHPGTWSRGVGHALISHVQDTLRTEGRASAYLWVLRGNDRAAAFYERHGWLEDGGTKVEERAGMRLPHLRRVKRLS